MSTTTGLNENLVHAPISNQASYKYRAGKGIIPSAEYSVYFNDFYENTSSNALAGTSVVIDTGATIDAPETDAISYTGVLSIESDGTTEGATMYWPKNIQLGLGKKFFMEARVYTDAAADTDVQFGLSDITASTNPEDIWTTAAANLIAFGVLDGDATVTMLCDKNNSGSSAELGTIDLSDATWHTLAIEVDGTAADGTMSVKGYVDGKLALTWSTETTIPDDLTLSPFFGGRNGSATTNNVYFDYIRWSIER
jgi:hypothetical protein